MLFFPELNLFSLDFLFTGSPFLLTFLFYFFWHFRAPERIFYLPILYQTDFLTSEPFNERNFIYTEVATGRHIPSSPGRFIRTNQPTNQEKLINKSTTSSYLFYLYHSSIFPSFIFLHFFSLHSFHLHSINTGSYILVTRKMPDKRSPF